MTEYLLSRIMLLTQILKPLVGYSCNEQLRFEYDTSLQCSQYVSYSARFEILTAVVTII
jgi:hypothetical protein